MLLLALILATPAAAPDAVLARSQVYATIPVDVRLAEAIAIDHGRLLTGSVLDGGLWIGRAGRWRRLADALPPGGVQAMARDPVRRLLWVSLNHTESGSGVNSIAAVDLRRLATVRLVEMPKGASSGDLAVAADGTVWVSDQANGGVYRCRPGCRTAEIAVGKVEAPQPQGIAPAPDGTIYLADYARGILRIDARSGRAEPLGNPNGAELRGIDGIVWWRGQLIGIQNGTRTRRILRIRLDRPGRIVVSSEPIEQAHAEWGEPTLAALDGDRLLYIADAQWEAWEGNVRKAGVPLRPTPVRWLRLRP